MAPSAAMMRFETGPASGDEGLAVAPAAQVRRVDRRRLGPAEQDAGRTAATMTSSSPPSGSKWTIGLSVSRPNSFAVPSPSR